MFTKTIYVGIVTAVVGSALVLAGPASAHITVDSPDAEPGGFGKLVFRVPTESDTASTTEVAIDLPAETPLAFVNAESIPGWDVSVKKASHDEPVEAEGFTLTETVETVVWTADDDSSIGPDEFAEFALSVGPLPKQDNTELSFDAEQVYSDGTTVNWDEETPASGDEPEHPAPTLTVTAADSPAEGTAEDAATVPRALAFSALGVSIIAAIIAVLAYIGLVRERRRAS